MPEPAGASFVFAGAVRNGNSPQNAREMLRSARKRPSGIGPLTLRCGFKRGNRMGDLQKLFNPKTIAVIGATEQEGTFGRTILENALASGDRTVYPVNPNRETVLGHPCWTGIDTVPGPVDLAIIATPAATVPAIVDACGRAGVEGIIIISAGFRETGEEGKTPGGGDPPDQQGLRHADRRPQLPGDHAALRRPQRHLPPGEPGSGKHRLHLRHGELRPDPVRLGNQRPHRFQHGRLPGFGHRRRFRRRHRLPRRRPPHEEHHPLHGGGRRQREAFRQRRPRLRPQQARHPAQTPGPWRMATAPA